jgi:hypothetical protein
MQSQQSSVISWLPIYLPASHGPPTSRCYSDYKELTLCSHIGFGPYQVGILSVVTSKYVKYVSENKNCKRRVPSSLHIMTTMRSDHLQ